MTAITSEARDGVLAALFEVYPDAVLLVDGAGRIAMANDRASTMLGYGQDELIGLSVDALVPDAVRPRHARYRASYGRDPQPRPMGTQLDLVARRRDGSEVMVEISLAPLLAQGLPYVMAALRAIGAYPRVKQALQRARYSESIARLGHVAVDASDSARVVREAPAEIARALELDSARVYVLDHDGRHFRIAGSEGAQLSEALGSRVPNDDSSAPGWLLQQGATVVSSAPPLAVDCASALGMPIADRGRIAGVLLARSSQAQRFDADALRYVEAVVSLLATVLQRAASEDALRHSQRLEAVGQLTGGIAHDFNNLLTVIQGNLQVLADLPSLGEDAAAQSMVGAATRASRRGADLTAKLLAFSRRQVLQPETIDLARMLPSLADLLRRTLDARIHIEVLVEADCPACLADPGQLEAALLNIAINARDAMPEGGTLAFHAQRCDMPPVAEPLAWQGPGVALSITDTGSGMSEAVQARAFEPFFTTKGAGRGTGLGLATVYGFAHQSQGAVALASRLGIGTTVTLYLPGPLQAPAETTASAPAAPAGVAFPTGLSVLVVEDEPEVLRVVQAFLTGWGNRVTTCKNAEAALAEVGSDRVIDLLLTDVMLGPGLHGTELAQRAQARRPGLPVLLMSGYASYRGKAPLQPLLRKPFTREQLAEALLRLLRRS